MKTNKITTENEFNKGLTSLRNISMTPREKGQVYHRLYNYAIANPPAKTSVFAVFFARLARVFRPIK